MCLLEISKVWKKITDEVSFLSKKELILSDFYKSNILQHKNLSDSISFILSKKLSTSTLSEKKIFNIFQNIYRNNTSILKMAVEDIKFIIKKDPAIKNYFVPLLYLKGFHALEAYRISNYLWKIKQNSLSIYFQSRISNVFSVDIHPAATIGSRVMFDHATGIVIGESVIIEDEVSIFQSVTLGSTGKDNSKKRHPTIRKGAIIGAGAKILGNIDIGLKSKVGAGSIVLRNVPSYVTVAGVPARIVSKLDSKQYSFREKTNHSFYSNKFQYGDGI